MNLSAPALRPLRAGSRHLCPARRTRPAVPLCCRSYSTSPSLVRSEQRPAPHVGHIQILSLDRPDARNAISRRLLADLRAAVDDLRCSPTGLRALILASNVDGVFCAGADLKERATFSLDE
jgi:methylglutaconyl-CoA hydratase